MRYARQLELALALVAVLLCPLGAGAQGFDEDRAGGEGPGFKAGRLVLHPGFSAEGGYDSNVFLQNENQEDSFILRLTGYLDVATEAPQRQREGETNQVEPQKIDFRGGIGVQYYQYFIDQIAPNAAADAHIDLSYNPSRVFSLQVRDTFRRTIRPFTDATTPEGETTSYGNNQNRGSLDLVARSKSGILEGSAGYTNIFQFFDSDVFQYGNSLTHQVPVRLSWSFFPSSALVYEARYSNQSFDETQVNSSATLLSDNNRIRTTFGYNGSLTERLSLTALLGYSAGFYALGQDFDGVIARVEAGWQPRPTISLSGGYARDIRPSFIGNFTESNRLFLETRFVVSGALLLGIKASVTFDKSGLALAPDGTLLGNEPFRKDIRVYAGLFGEYRFTSWFALFGRIGYLSDFTDFEYVGADPLLSPSASYQRFDAWLGLRVFY
jgi:hypothetical protein